MIKKQASEQTRITESGLSNKVDQSTDQISMNYKTDRLKSNLQTLNTNIMAQSKSQAKLSITIGTIPPVDNERLPSTIEFRAYTLKSQIQDLNNFYKQILGISKVPFILAEIPEYFPVEKVPIFSQIWRQALKDEISQTINTPGSNFYLIDIKDPQEKVLLYIKKFNKVFSQLNTTKKQLFAEINFYDIDKKISKLKAQQKPLISLPILLDNCQIKAFIDLSAEFWEMLLALTEKISPKFANSPLMAVLPLMEHIKLNLRQKLILERLDSINKLNESMAEQFLFGRVNEQLYQQGVENRSKMKVYISFEELGYLEIIIDADIFGVLQFDENDGDEND